MLVIRAKFDKLKEEVNFDLGIFAGDLVGILEKSVESHPEWKENLEDLLVVARQCAKMPPNEFWMKCEGIVQNLDDKRQELPMGTLKQAHTRLLFILTRCTRLVQFQKENGYEEDHILGLHQLSDLGVYPEQIYGAALQEYKSTLSGKEVNEKQNKKSHSHEQSTLNLKQEQPGHQLSSGADGVEVGTAKSVDSAASSYRMSSWKKLPSAAEKNQKKGLEGVDTPSEDKLDKLHVKEELKPAINDTHENLDTPLCPPENSEASSKVQKVSWGDWGDHQHVTYENSMICRICEVEIPTVHVEEHSRICTIADRCDLKGLTVNERLERVAETLEKILESWTAKSTPRSTNAAGESPEVARMSTSSIPENLDELLPKQSSLSRQCSVDMLVCAPEVDNVFAIEDLNVLPDLSCETHCMLNPDPSTKSSSGGSLTPRSTLLTPRTSQIELLLSEKKTIAEHENYQQVCKCVPFAREFPMNLL